MFLPTFLIERQGYAHDAAAYWVAAAMVVNAPGCVLGGWLLRRGWSSSRVVALAYLGMLVSTPGIFADHIDPGLRLACAIFMPFIGGMIPPAVLARTGALAARARPSRRPASGWSGQMLMLNQLVGPPIPRRPGGRPRLLARRANWPHHPDDPPRPRRRLGAVPDRPGGISVSRETMGAGRGEDAPVPPLRT